MARPPINYVNELIGGLVSNKRLPMQPSPGLQRHLSEYRSRRAGRPNDMTNIIDPMNMVGAERPPGISVDPWFDPDAGDLPPFEKVLGGAASSSRIQDPGLERTTLVSDMMRATGIEPRGSYDRYFSQLMEVNDAFIKRVARQLGLSTDSVSPNELRSLLATEFEYYGK